MKKSSFPIGANLLAKTVTISQCSDQTNSQLLWRQHAHEMQFQHKLHCQWVIIIITNNY